MSRIRADRYTNREGTGAPTFSSGVNVVGISSVGITTVTGIGQTALTVNGDARITGVLTVGQGSVTISGDGISGITTAGITTAYVTSINDLNFPTAGSLSNRNIIINGAMMVAQRGTSSTSGSYGTVDRFRTSYNNGTITQSQETLASVDTPYNLGFRKYWRTTNTTPPNNLTASHRRMLIRIEAQDIANSGWDYTNSNSYITLSMWVRSNVAQTFNWFAQTLDGTQHVYPFEVILAANTWTKVEQSFPGNANLAFDDNSELGFMLDCGMFWGTDYTDTSATLDQWNGYSFGARTQPYDSTWANTTDATFDMTAVQLEVGSKATPFEHESYGQTLAKCQRYRYQRDLGNQSDVQHLVMTRFEASSGVAYANVGFPCEMRINPNFTFTGTTHSATGYAGNPVLNNTTKTSCDLRSTRSASANGTLYLRPIASSAGSDVLILNWDAEL